MWLGAENSNLKLHLQRTYHDLQTQTQNVRKLTMHINNGGKRKVVAKSVK